MRALLDRQGKLKAIDWSKPEGISEINEKNNKIIEEYMPYNSMVLWTLNGLVPDDINNTFSNKSCAIIEGLLEQIEQSELISLIPTDTAIKGSIKLSESATILINKQRYELLSEEEKDKLDRLDIKIAVFEGELKDAVSKELKESNRYTKEELSLRKEDRGYIKSPTSDELRKIISEIAEERNIAQELHWNVITGHSDDLDKLDSVRNEFKNIGIVNEFYIKTFFEYLFSKMDIDSSINLNNIITMESNVYMENLCNEIERIGIDKYKKVLDRYNTVIERLKAKGKLPTPQQIVDLGKEREIIDLINLTEAEEFDR